MALSKQQERVERSLFHIIRKKLVTEGYLPDITNIGLFGSEPYTAANELAWKNALKAIAANPAKKFAIEIFGHSQTKGVKTVPRIAMFTRRTLTGEVGAPMQPILLRRTASPKDVGYVQLALQSYNLYIDIHLVSNSAAQDRVMHAVLGSVLPTMKFIPYYDDPTDLIFVRQTNEYDLPDTTEGIEEKVYTFEIPDLFDLPEDGDPVVPIKEITAEIISVTPNSTILPNGDVLGESTEDGNVQVDNEGITYN